MGIPGDLVPPATEYATENRTNGKSGAEEREEGEIIDDFEDIISSDEELSMKRRIEELEERNLELEKIANISAVYNYGYNKDRFDIKSLPVSDISDNDELYLPPKSHKVKHRTKKVSKASTARTVNRKSYLREHSHERNDLYSQNSISRARSTSRKRKYQKNSRSRNRRKSVKIRKKSTSLKHSSSEDEFCALNRDELRLAVKRDVNIESRKNVVENMLADKQAFVAKQSVVEHIIDLADDSDVEEKNISNEDVKDEKEDSDDSVSLEEQELRLIALKSAIMKKAIKRKKRKESENKKPYSPSEFVELRGTFSPRHSIESGPMDISPIASPECLDCNKSVDMDLVSSNSSSPILVGHAGTWIPIDKIPIINSYSQPPVIIHSPTPINISSSPNNEITPRAPSKDEIDDDNIKINIRSSTPEQSDEEELALRALLLSKMRSNKESKAATTRMHEENKTEVAASNPELVVDSKSPISEHVNKNDDISLDPDVLRKALLVSMKQKIMNKTEIVLKEAVRRLKNKTQSQNVEYQEVLTENHDEIQPEVLNTNPFPCDVDYRIFSRGSNLQSAVAHNFGNASLDEELKENIQQVISVDANKMERVPEYPSTNLENGGEINSMGMGCMKDVCQQNILESRAISEMPLSSGSTQNIMNVPLLSNANSRKILKGKNPGVVNRTALKPVPILNSTTAFEQNIPSVNHTETQGSHKYPAVEEREQIASNSVVPKPVPVPVPFVTSENRISLVPVRNALKTVPITTSLEVPAALKAVNIPKMKTKVIRTRTKVVNKTTIPSVLVKRKSATKLVEQSPLKKKMKLDTTLLKIKELSRSSRLITKIDVPTVQKMVIHLGNSDSESDEFANDFHTCTKDTTAREDYFDNASPMSLPMDSPCYSPLPNSSAAAADEVATIGTPPTAPSAKKSIVNDIFQARLDEFLKNARKKVEQNQKEKPTQVTNTPEAKVEPEPSITTTPLAVRHLPPSSQLEYRRLVSRMKILEKQKQARNNKLKSDLDKIKVTIKNDPATEQKISELPAVPVIPAVSVDQVTDAATVPVVTVSNVPSGAAVQRIVANNTTQPIVSETESRKPGTNPNDSLIKKVLKKATLISSTSPEIKSVVASNVENGIKKAENQSEEVESKDEAKDAENLSEKQLNEELPVKCKKRTVADDKPPQVEEINRQNISEEIDPNSLVATADLLETYETDYKKNSSYLYENISKAMELVQVAKEEKTKKLVVQCKLEQLKREMEKLESELEHQNKILSKIYPQISDHHRCITDLKSKCVKLEKFSRVLGKKLKGRSYGFKSILGHAHQRYKEFALEIKNLKELRVPQLINAADITVDEKSAHNKISSNNLSNEDMNNIISIQKISPSPKKSDTQVPPKVELRKTNKIGMCVKTDKTNRSSKLQSNNSTKIDTGSHTTFSNDNQVRENTERATICSAEEITNIEEISSECDTEIRKESFVENINPVKKVNPCESQSNGNDNIQKIVSEKISADTILANKVEIDEVVGACPSQTVMKQTPSVENLVDTVDNSVDNKIGTDLELKNDVETIEKAENHFQKDNSAKTHQVNDDSAEIQPSIDGASANVQLVRDGGTTVTLQTDNDIAETQQQNNDDTRNTDKFNTEEQQHEERKIEENIESAIQEKNSMNNEYIINTSDNDIHEYKDKMNSNLRSLAEPDTCEEHEPTVPEKTNIRVHDFEISENRTGSNLVENCHDAIKSSSEAQLCSDSDLSARELNTTEGIEECAQKESSTSKIEEYISPLAHLNDKRHFNPDGIICPFQLMGQCDDQQCKYEHLPQDTNQS